MLGCFIYQYLVNCKVWKKIRDCAATEFGFLHSVNVNKIIGPTIKMSSICLGWWSQIVKINPDAWMKEKL